MKSSELVRLLKKDGWFVIRQTGSHMIMEHPSKKGQIVCPYHGSQEVGKGLEKKIKKDGFKISSVIPMYIFARILSLRRLGPNIPFHH